MAYNKYRNKWVILDGIKFQSIAEGQRYCYLKLLKKSGEVLAFEMQKSYIVAKAGTKTIRYRADFVVYWKDGSTTVEDVKGVKTAVYKLKKLLMLEKYGIEIVEITAR